ncbi:MAG: hypothetical protein ACRCUY_06525 [Thermoguttaceae bacterium]
MTDPMIRLMELDAHHNELLARLEVLDQEIAAVLGDWTRSKEGAQPKHSQVISMTQDKVAAAA